MKGSNDPCPPRGKGTFKVANVCINNPYVYYTKTSRISNRDFKDAIDDLYLPMQFPKILQKYYMMPVCRVDGIPKKINVETAVVEKLTSVVDAMRELGSDKVIRSYIKFVEGYLKDVSKLNPDDIWQVVSTDFKTDNVMVDLSSKRFYITDFTPAHASDDGTFSLIMTEIFVLGHNMTDYSPSKKYNNLDMSKISYEICLLCALTTLCFMIGASEALETTSKTAFEDRAYDWLEKIEKRCRSLKIRKVSDRIKYVVGEISRNYKEYDVSKWLSVNPFSRRSPGAGGKQTRKKRDAPCQVFLKAMKSRAPVIINPVTGKKINKRDSKGRPTALIKKLIKQCK